VSGALLARRDKKKFRVRKGDEREHLELQMLGADKWFATVKPGKLRNGIKRLQNQAVEISCYQLK